MPSTKHPLTIALTCAVALGSVHADDASIRDVRVNYGQDLTSHTDFATDNVYEYDVRSDRWFFDVQYVRSLHPLGTWGSPIYGIEAFVSQLDGKVHSEVADPAHIDVDAYGLTGLLGYAYRLPSLPELHAEATAFGSYGKATLDYYFASQGYSGSDALVEYGFRLGAYYTFTRREQIGVDLRYTVKSDVSPVLSNGSSNLRTKIENDSLAIAISLGYRLE